MKRKLSVLAALLFVGGLVLSGCSENSSTPSTPSTNAAPAAPSTNK